MCGSVVLSEPVCFKHPNHPVRAILTHPVVRQDYMVCLLDQWQTGGMCVGSRSKTAILFVVQKYTIKLEGGYWLPVWQRYLAPLVISDGDLRTLRNWRSFRLVQYFCAKISMNFWIKLATQGYVFINTPTHNAKSKGLAKSKHLCLLVTGCIFNHSVLLVSVNRMNITVGLTHVPQRTRASVSSRPQSQYVHTEEFVEGRTLPIHCSN